jgi:hypothetical protein
MSDPLERVTATAGRAPGPERRPAIPEAGHLPLVIAVVLRVPPTLPARMLSGVAAALHWKRYAPCAPRALRPLRRPIHAAA